MVLFVQLYKFEGSARTKAFFFGKTIPLVEAAFAVL
jgi:hypothetical protein